MKFKHHIPFDIMICTDEISQQFQLSREAAQARAVLSVSLTDRISEPEREITLETYNPTWIVYRPIFKRMNCESPIPKIIVRKNEDRRKEEGPREYKNSLKDVKRWIQEMTLSETPAPACFNENLFSFLNE